MTLFLDENEEISVKIINQSTNILDTSTSEILENQMNQLLLSSLRRQTFISKMESVFETVTTTLKKVHTNLPSMNNENCNQHISSKTNSTASHQSKTTSKSSKMRPMKTVKDVIHRYVKFRLTIFE